MLTALEEAALIGVHPSNVSRARKDTGHPVHGAAAAVLFGNPRYRTAPKPDVIAWWARRHGKGPGVVPATPTPEGWNVRQWEALKDAARGEPLSEVMGQVLRDRRVIDGAGRLTDEGQSILSEHTTATDRA